MPVESATYISQLNPAYPDGANPKSEGDNHLRLIKEVLQDQFPNFGAASMNASTVELNYMVGVTSAVQTQLNARSLKAGETYTGTHNFTGATVSVGSPADGNSAVSRDFVYSVAFSTALPGGIPMVTAESMFMASF